MSHMIGEYRETPKSLADEMPGVAQVDERGNLLGNGAPFEFVNISSATTTLVKSGRGHLHGLTINASAAGTITLYDDVTATGTKIATIKASAAEQTLIYDVVFETGLTIVTAAASDLTVSYL